MICSPVNREARVRSLAQESPVRSLISPDRTSNFTAINMGRDRQRGQRLRSLLTDRRGQTSTELSIFINQLDGAEGYFEYARIIPIRLFKSHITI